MVGLPCFERRPLPWMMRTQRRLRFRHSLRKSERLSLASCTLISMQIQFRRNSELPPAQFPEHLVLDARPFVQEFVPGFRCLGVKKAVSHLFDDCLLICHSLHCFRRGFIRLLLYLVVSNRRDVADRAPEQFKLTVFRFNPHFSFTGEVVRSPLQSIDRLLPTDTLAYHKSIVRFGLVPARRQGGLNGYGCLIARFLFLSSFSLGERRASNRNRMRP